MAVFEKIGLSGRLPQDQVKHIVAKYQQKIDDNTAYIKVHGIDMPEIEAWQWTRNS
jgi:phosphoketolase